MCLLLSCFGVLQRVLTHIKLKSCSWVVMNSFLSIVVGWASCTKAMDIPLSVIIAYFVDKVVHHWIMFVQYWITMCGLHGFNLHVPSWSTTAAVWDEFDTTSPLRTLAHCSKMNCINLSDVRVKFLHAWDAVQCLVSSAIYTCPVNLHKNVSGKVFTVINYHYYYYIFIQHVSNIHACYFCSERGHWTLLISSARMESPMSRKTSTRVDQVTGCLPLPVSHSCRISMLIRSASFECL